MAIFSKASKWLASDDNDRRKVDVITALTSAIIVGVVLALIMRLVHITPFGENSFASHDADIQYLDFFAYLKDCLSGKASLRYTLSSGLGGTTIGLFAYYLASPFNVLVAFFSKSELNNFFSLLVVLKLMLAGCTMSVFLNKRFQYELKPYWVILLSISYALMQYSFAQNSNIMWLDGVYMLPIILLGTYYAVKQGKTTLLSISVALAIIFNWYSAGIDCLFSIAWFVMELLLATRDVKGSWRSIVRRGLKYAWGMLLGVLISACLFLPAILILRQGRGSSFDWGSFRPDFSGNLFRSVQLYTIGSKSDKGGASIYCGCLALLGVVGYFTSQNVSRRNKCIAGAMLLFSILIFYWQPLEITYSLFKNVNSYWFRYAYVASFLMIFLAASYFRGWEKEQNTPFLLKVGCCLGLLILGLQLAGGSTELKLVYYTVGFLVIEAALLACAQKQRRKGLLQQEICMAGLALIVVIELLENGKVLANAYSNWNVADYRKYVAVQQRQIDAIKARGHGAYRINQTATRNEWPDNMTANYNESLAFGYNGIASYASTLQNRPLDFLARAGYRTEGGCIAVVETPILPVDSLLGARYILSSMSIKGYDAVDNMPTSADDKKVYQNPYALPMAFTVSAHSLDGQAAKSAAVSDNQFKYMNALYSQLLGRDVKIYEPVKYRAREEADGSYEYRLRDINKSWPVYGNIIFDDVLDIRMNVNGQYTQGYAKWMAPSVFYIPTTKSSAKLELTSASPIKPQKAQFYMVNLDEMRQVAGEISEHAAKFTDHGDGRLTVDATASTAGDKLILSVPYDSGWHVTNNGKPVQVEMFAGSLMKVPLNRGRNHIEFSYRVPGLYMGAAISAIGVALLVGTSVFEHKRRYGSTEPIN